MLVDERTAASRVPQALIPTALVAARRHGASTLVAVSVALAALTMAAPSAPTYDPWAWIIWGREIAHLDLVTTAGPSWKPLPVLFTTVFSLFGSIAPDLWLVVARAGAIAAVILAFRVARRLGGGLVGGTAAAAALALAPWWIRNAALGNSEGLLVAFLLGALDRELDGQRRAAFLLACAAALLRPEVWPLLGLYGLWLLWRRALPFRLVLGAGAIVVALWLLPEWWGSGDLLRAAHRAKDVNPGAPTYDDDPALAVLRSAGEMLTVPLIAGLAAALGALVVRRDRAFALVLALAVVLLAVVMRMTSDGFSGNQRYLIAPIALLIVLAGAGAGAALDAIGRRLAPRRTGSAGWPLVGVACVAIAAAFAGPSIHRLAPTLRSLAYQAHLTDALPSLIQQAGGAKTLTACGPAVTGPYLVPAVAWNLGVHTHEVELAPRRPSVVFRVRTTKTSALVPDVAGVGHHELLAHDRSWRIVSVCDGSTSASILGPTP